MAMFDGKTTPEEIIKLVYQKIDELGGLAKAFPHNKKTQLYSGPNYRFFLVKSGEEKKVIGPDKKNEDRAKDQAKEKSPKATLINDTPIGKFLFETNHLYKWLQEHNLIPGTTEIDWDLADKKAKQVMTEVSALFIRTIHGEVETAVCGAARDRVFYEAEQKGLCDRNAFPKEAQVLVDELCANDDITKINGVDIKHFRKIHDSGDYEGVYRLICLTELRDRLHHAKRTGDVDAFKDYLDRKELYEYDQIHLSTSISSRPVYQKHLRPEAERVAERDAKILAFEATYAASPSTPAPRVPRGGKPSAPSLH